MSSDRGSLAMSHTLSPPKPLMPQPNRTNSAQPHRVTPGPPIDTPVSFSSRLRAWQPPECGVLPFEDLDAASHLRSSTSRVSDVRCPGAIQPRVQPFQTRVGSPSSVARRLSRSDSGTENTETTQPSSIAAVNEPHGLRRHARDHRIGLLVAAIAAAFALASCAAQLSDPT